MSIFSIKSKKIRIHQNVIILEGIDGFTKQVLVDKFPPVYEIAMLPPIQDYFMGESESPQMPTVKIRQFFPKEESSMKGITFIKYKEFTPPTLNNLIR